MYFDNFEFYYICERTHADDCFADNCKVCDMCRFQWEHGYIPENNQGLLRTVYAEGEV